VWKALYEVLERELTGVGLVPLSEHPIRPRLEMAFSAVWSAGGHPSMSRLLRFGDDNAGTPGERCAPPAVHPA
jgi:hypothetical protein